MTRFCTNCGHPNDASHNICIECGTALVKPEPAAPAPKPAKEHKPMGKKAKLLAATGLFLVVLSFGIYAWGTNTASADSVASKFFEALQTGDAEAVAKQAVLSDGKALTVGQAQAFISMYRGVTAGEMEAISTLEKRGKVIGIFDAHKVVLPAQTLSFDFPEEGLGLELNGEKVADVAFSDGTYTFSNLSPGEYQAEFVYEGGTEGFSHPFDLAIAAQWDTDWIASIGDEIQFSFVTFKLSTYDSGNPEANKVVIGDQEFAVGENGETEKIGPILADGSLIAEGIVEYPWGERRSEPVAITGDYLELDTAGLGEEHTASMIDQSLAFAEEYVEAMGTRDFSGFTTVTANAEALMADKFKEMERLNEHFKGSLKQVGIAEDTVTISKDKKTVSVDGEFVLDGVYYFREPADREGEITTAVIFDFIYDDKEGKWLVDSFKETLHPLNFQTTDVTASGTYYETVLEPTEVAKKPKKDEKEAAGENADSKKESDSKESEGGSEDDAEKEFQFERHIDEFFNNYNRMSVAAINSGNFAEVSSMIHPSGPRYKEQSDFIDYLYGKGITEEFNGSIVEKVVENGDGFYTVTTIEDFVIHGTERSSEKQYRTVTKMKIDENGWYVYELISTTEI